MGVHNERWKNGAKRMEFFKYNLYTLTDYNPLCQGTFSNKSLNSPAQLRIFKKCPHVSVTTDHHQAIIKYLE
jgi:hypothetical protein